ncbi:MAG TPA: hypothetical protein VGQ48_06915 [Gemmatimonadales bacterium]|nr:hypothetical protein [Gemmatimonadales bacterium]
MNERDLTRPSFVKRSLAAVGPALVTANELDTARMTVVCVGAHPDDPESGCAEIMAQWRGREVGVPAAEAFVHLNRDTHGSNLPGL